MTNAELSVRMTLKDKVTKELQGMQGKFRRFGDTVKQHWIGIAAGTAVAGLAMKKIIGDSIEFETAFAGVKKTVDATSEEFKRLSDGLREMSKEIPVSAKDLAGIQEIAGQLGVRGVANLTKFTETIAKISVSTNLTREVAATNFARIANVMQESLLNVDRMGASIVELGNNFATTETEITEFAQRIAGAGRIFNLSTSDILGIGTAFTAVGVEAQLGGTAVQKVLISMLKATQNGGAELEKFSKILGITSEEFIKLKNEQPQELFIRFVESLGKAGDSAITILKELGLQDQRLIRALLSVANAGDLQRKAIEKSNEAWEKNSALNEEAAKKFGTTASQIQLFKNHIADLNIAMGEVFLPIILKTIPVLNQFIRDLGVAIKEVSLGRMLLEAEELRTKIEELNKPMTFWEAFNEANFPDMARTLRLAEASEGLADIQIKLLKMGAYVNETDFAMLLPEDLARVRKVIEEMEKAAERKKELRDEEIEAEREKAEQIANNQKDISGETDEIIKQSFLEKEQKKLDDLKAMWDIYREEESAKKLAEIQQDTEQYQFFIETQKKANESLWTIAGNLRDTFSKGMSKMFVDMIKGNANVKKSFEDLGWKMIDILIEFAVQKAINFALAKTMLAGHVAASTAAGAAVAQAWAPAASMASLASFGANAGPAAAGLITTTALAHALALPKAAEGAIVEKPTILLAGEKGREAIIPLDRGPGVARAPINNTFHFSITISGTNEEIREKLEDEDYWTTLMRRTVIKVIRQENDLVLGSVWDK